MSRCKYGKLKSKVKGRRCKKAFYHGKKKRKSRSRKRSRKSRRKRRKSRKKSRRRQGCRGCGY